MPPQNTKKNHGTKIRPKLTCMSVRSLVITQPLEISIFRNVIVLLVFLVNFESDVELQVPGVATALTRLT